MSEWRNWARNQVCAPAAVAHPRDVDELAAVVKAAAASGSTVKVVGAGHSFTDIACTTGTQVVLDEYEEVVSADVASRLVTVQAGIPIRRLNATLDSLGLALPNLGDIDAQTISGAVLDRHPRHRRSARRAVDVHRGDGDRDRGRLGAPAARRAEEPRAVRRRAGRVWERSASSPRSRCDASLRSRFTR